jgi:hypothetical protein
MTVGERPVMFSDEGFLRRELLKIFGVRQNWAASNSDGLGISEWAFLSPPQI